MSLSRTRDNIKFDDVLIKINNYITDEHELDVIKKAYDLAFAKHEGQYRKTGEAYIIHPLNVAVILTEIYADYETISAGLLHDVLEDCDCTVEEMEKEVGTNITKLVQVLLSYLKFISQLKMII